MTHLWKRAAFGFILAIITAFSYNFVRDLIAAAAPATPSLENAYQADNVKTPDTTPLFRFTSTDPDNDSIVYEINWDTDSSFPAATSKVSDTDAGFANVTTPADTSPFNSGDTISYTVQSALTNDTTYFYRVRAKDPTGTNTWSSWSSIKSFTIDTDLYHNTWFQTHGDQFSENSFDGATVYEPTESEEYEIDDADTVANWTASDATNTPATQETTIKQEGTGSVKIATTAVSGSSTTIDLMEYSSDGTAQSAYVTNALIATGGTTYDSGVYRYHKFTSDSTFSVTNSGSVAVLLVGGGGGGGGNYGNGGNSGGGAGGVVYNSSFTVSSNVTVDIGAGGAASSTGSNTTFSSLTAYGGGYGAYSTAGGNGGSGGGGKPGGNGTPGQGYGGGDGWNSGNNSGGGGGGGAGEVGEDSLTVSGRTDNAGDGGDGTSAYSSVLSIVGAGENVSGTYYIGGGGGGGDYGDPAAATSGLGGYGGGGKQTYNGTANTGGGGGGAAEYPDSTNEPGGSGGSGLLVAWYPYLVLQSYSEATIKTEGSYSLKGVAKATNSLNKTLTRTISSPVNLSDHNLITFDMRASLTGSNIKVGFHDAGGTTTEVTPNITSADTFQEVSVNLGSVANANKDAIDQIIITIVDADSDNTFYIDDIKGWVSLSQDDTVTSTKSAMDLSDYSEISFWVRSTVATTSMRFQFGESVSTEQTYDITINSADTWEEKIWDISGISESSRDAVTKFAFAVIDASAAQSFYFDDINASKQSVYGYGVGIAHQVDDADTVANWTSSDAVNSPISQETSIKQEGTGSVKAVTSGTSTTSTNIDLIEYTSDANAQAAYVTNALIATGGTTYDSGVYRYHKFTSDSTFSVTNSGSVAVLLVGGGGGGGGNYGNGGNSGGGAGGVVYNSSFTVSSNVTVDIGAGGAASSTGSNTTFSSLTAYGGGYGAYSTAGGNGGSGGGGKPGGNGTPGQGYGGGDGWNSGNNSGGGGGGGAGEVGEDSLTVSGRTDNAGDGGDGTSAYSSVLSIVGAGENVSGTYYIGGGGGGGDYGDPAAATSGLGGYGGGGKQTYNGTANTGGGGGGAAEYPDSTNEPGGSGGSGLLVAWYPYLVLQSYSEATIKTEGSYSLKGVAKATNSLNKTLTRTISSPLDLSYDDSITFDIRSTRTGSNIKVGFHDAGGTTTEVTPNITSANTFQEVTVDLSGVSNANKDAIDQIIITIVNADSDNTFYIDNVRSNVSLSHDDTITTTKSATNLSEYSQITFYVRSSIAGSHWRFQFGESTSSEQTYDITINSADTWEKKTWDISGISESARDAVTLYAFKNLTGVSSESFYFDDIWAESLSGTMISTAITAAEFYDATYWYQMTYTEETGSDIDYQVLFNNDGTFYLIPDTDLPSNSSGLSSISPISLMNLVNKYPTIYLKATLTAGTVRPILWDWGITTEFVPDPPSNLLVQGLPNPAGVETITPYFSAICNHQTELDMNKYRIEVDDTQDFSSPVWDSGSSGTTMTDCTPGSRSQNITYAGDTLTFNGQRYYWRIKFWDEYGIEGYWSNSMDLFVMNSPPETSAAAPFGCLIKDSPNDSYLKLIWEDKSSDETQFTIEKNTNSGGFVSLYNAPAGATYYNDTGVSSGNTYQYRVRAEGGTTTEWCTTSTLDLSEGTFNLNGINIQGLTVQ